jgi:hypothetical protein
MPLNDLINLRIQTVPSRASGGSQIGRHGGEWRGGGWGGKRAAQLSKITDRAVGYKEAVRVGVRNEGCGG